MRKRMLLGSLAVGTVALTSLAYAYYSANAEWLNTPGLMWTPTTGSVLNTPNASPEYLGGSYIDIATYADGTSFGVGSNIHGGVNHQNDDITFNRHFGAGNRTLLGWQDYPGINMDGDNLDDGLNAVDTLEWDDINTQDHRRVAVATGHVTISPGGTYDRAIANFIFDGNVGESSIGETGYNLLDENVIIGEDEGGDGVDIVAGVRSGLPYCWVVATQPGQAAGSAGGYQLICFEIKRKSLIKPVDDFILVTKYIVDVNDSTITPKQVLYDNNGYVYVCGTKSGTSTANDFYLKKYVALSGVASGATVVKDFGNGVDDSHNDVFVNATLVDGDRSVVMCGTVNAFGSPTDIGVVQFSSSMTEMGTKQFIGSPNNGADVAVAVKDFGTEGEGQKVVIVAGTAPMSTAGDDYMFAKVPVSSLSTPIYTKGYTSTGNQVLSDMDVRATGDKRVFLSGINGSNALSAEYKDTGTSTPTLMTPSHAGTYPGYTGAPYSINSAYVSLAAYANHYCAGVDRLLVGGGTTSYSVYDPTLNPPQYVILEGGASMWRLRPSP